MNRNISLSLIYLEAQRTVLQGALCLCGNGKDIEQQPSSDRPRGEKFDGRGPNTVFPKDLGLRGRLIMVIECSVSAASLQRCQNQGLRID